jgi:hypothetical protein
VSPFNKGKFRSTVSTHHNPTAGEKVPAKSSPTEKKGPAEAGSTPEHVTKTHPGETQPHPQTGVHAFHAHHTGGGQYTSHTHHDDGTVQTQQHGSGEEMHDAMVKTLPGDTGHMGGDTNEEMGTSDFAEQLGGIGGKDSY